MWVGRVPMDDGFDHDKTALTAEKAAQLARDTSTSQAYILARASGTAFSRSLWSWIKWPLPGLRPDADNVYQI
jgi:hypothetical protein